MERGDRIAVVADVTGREADAVASAWAASGFLREIGPCLRLVRRLGRDGRVTCEVWLREPHLHPELGQGSLLREAVAALVRAAADAAAAGGTGGAA